MKNPSEPFRAVFDLSLDALILTLKEAQDYHRAAEGARESLVINSVC
jgi:hypothetical protein